jgi:hypothetical protein
MKTYETYKIGEHEVRLYQIKFITNKLGWTPMAIRQKEKRGVIPPANFRSPSGNRLYTIEEMALLEYIFKEIWPYRQGVKTPLWFKIFTKDMFAVIRQKIVENGIIESADDFNEIHERYGGNGFNKYRAWIYVLSWKEIFEEDKNIILRDLITELEDEI